MKSNKKTRPAAGTARRPSALDRCEHCDERLRPARVRVYRYRRKHHVLFEKVPALVCNACGHRVFEAAAVEAMEHALKNPSRGKRRQSLVVLTA